MQLGFLLAEVLPLLLGKNVGLLSTTWYCWRSALNKVEATGRGSGGEGFIFGAEATEAVFDLV